MAAWASPSSTGSSTHETVPFRGENGTVQSSDRIPPAQEEAHASRCKPPEPRKNGLPCKVRRAHGLIHRRSAAEEALSVLCSGLVTGSAPGHAHTALDGAQSSLAALNGLGQGGGKGPSHWKRTVGPTWASSALARESRDSTRSTHCSIDWRPGAAWAGGGNVAVARAISAAERRDVAARHVERGMRRP